MKLNQLIGAFQNEVVSIKTCLRQVNLFYDYWTLVFDGV